MGLIAGSELIVITPPNSPPQWTGTPAPNGTAGQGSTFALANFTADPDQDTLTYSWDNTSTPLPSWLTLNTSTGLLTIDTNVVESITSSIRFKIDDGVNTPVTSPNITVNIGPAPPSGGGGKRWNPGHYLKASGNPCDADQTGYWSQVLSQIASNASHSTMTGALVGLAWGRGNPTGNTFDFSDIYDCLAALNGKQLIVMAAYKDYESSEPGLHAPADLQDQIVTQNQGKVACVWRNGTEGFPDVSQRFSNFLVAFINEFDSNPQVEMLSQDESTPSLGGVTAPADYTTLKMSTALQDNYAQAVAATDKMNFAPMINSLGQEVDNLLEQCFSIGCGVGHPDSRPTPGYDQFEGIGAVRDYRTILPNCGIASNSVLVTKTNFTPAQVILNEQNHKTTHLAWISYATAAGRTWSDITAAIQANPLLHTACPTAYASCDTGVTTVITSVNFSFPTLRNTAPGNSVIAEESDNWPITWAWDDNQYTSFGDGKGFHNLAGNAETRGSFGFSRISGGKGSYSAQDVFKSGENMPSSEQGKCYGMLGANGKLYAAVDYYLVGGNGSREDRYHGLSVISSANAGVSWTEEIRWDAGDWGAGAANQLTGFYSMAFVQFGQDHAKPAVANSAAATDAYVYALLCEHDDDVYEVQNPGGITLIRCLESNLESGNKAHWSYCSAIDVDNVPSWSTTLTDRIMIFQDTSGNGGNDSSSMSYNEPLGRYILTTMQNSRYTSTHPSLANTCIIGIYDAPEPWGPWHQILKQNVETLGLADGDACIFWGFSNKWLSADGLSFVMVGTLLGQDEWGTVEGTFTFG